MQHCVHTCSLSKCKSPTRWRENVVWILIVDMLSVYYSEVVSDTSSKLCSSDPAVGLFLISADMMVIMLIKMLLSIFSVYSIMSGEATADRFWGAQLEMKKKCKCIWNKEKASNPINCNWERWLALIKIFITRTMVINYIKTFTNGEAGRRFFRCRNAITISRLFLFLKKIGNKLISNHFCLSNSMDSLIEIVW